MTLSASTIWSALMGLGIPYAKVGAMNDVQYQAATSEWLLGDFHRYFQRTMDTLEIKWSDDERSDCDKASLLFQAFAVIAHARTPEGKGGALPIGRITLRPDAEKNDFRMHTAVWAYTADKALIIIEPQVVGRVLNYTPLQFATTEHLSS